MKPKIGKYYKLKLRNGIYKCIDVNEFFSMFLLNNELKCFFKEDYVDLTELPDFTGFKKGYYYRYWRTDGKKPFFCVSSMERMFDGDWRECKGGDLSGVVHCANIESIGYWSWFNSTNRNSTDIESFYDFYEEISSEGYYKKFGKIIKYEKDKNTYIYTDYKITDYKLSDILKSNFNCTDFESLKELAGKPTREVNNNFNNSIYIKKRKFIVLENKSIGGLYYEELTKLFNISLEEILLKGERFLPDLKKLKNRHCIKKRKFVKL